MVEQNIDKGFGHSLGKKIAAPQFHTWSPTALLSVALSGLTNVDRTGNSIFRLIWPQPTVSFLG